MAKNNKPARKAAKKSAKKTANKAIKTSTKTDFKKDDLQKIRKDLLEEKANILQEIISISEESLKKSAKDASGDLSGYSFHMADMATDLYDREFSLELAETERKGLYALDDAIKRIDEGTYGICDMCGCKISKSRLKVMPQAGYCIKCQEKTEKKESR